MKSNLSFITFQTGHLDLFKKKEVFATYRDLKTRTSKLVNHPGAYTRTILLDGRPIAVIGVVKLWDGVAEAWSVTSDEVRRVPLSFHKVVSGLIKAVERHLGIRRIQMSVDENYSEGHRWAEALGFKREGLMLKYGPIGENHFLYARTR